MPNVNKKVLVGIILAFVCVLVIGLAEYPVPTSTTETNTSDWKTYTDSELGFTFDYPSTWNGGGFSGYANRNVEIHPPNSSDAEDFFGVLQDNVTTLDRILTLKDVKTIEISGKTAYQNYIKTDRPYESFIYIPSANHIVIYFSPDTPDILQILSTFKFTDFIIRKDWGVSFQKTNEWEVATNTAMGGIVLTQKSGEGQGDRITISHIASSTITDNDAKFGPATYFYDKTNNSWMRATYSSELDGQVPTAKAVPVSYTLDKLPIFRGTSRWATYIIPLSNNSILKLNITGSGSKTALDELIKTIKK